MPAIHNKNPENRKTANGLKYPKSHTTRKIINIENLYKLRDAYFQVCYGDQLWAGGLHPQQVLISNQMINEFVYGHTGLESNDIYINVARQFGKSYIVFGMIGFFLVFMPEVLKKKITIGITINKKDQVTKNYDEVRKGLERVVESFGLTFGDNTKNGLSLSNGSKIVIFSMAANNNEGETLDFSIVDEAQDLDDEKYEKEIVPMMATTGGITTYLGVGGYQVNDYMTKLNDVSTPNVFKYDCYQLLETMEDLYKKTGDFRYSTYKNSIKKAKAKGGAAFETQWELKWLVEVGNFIRLESLQKMKGEYTEIEDYEVQSYMGIDWAKSGDRTIATIVGNIDGKYKILKWIKIPTIGMSYPDQIRYIRQQSKDYNIQKIFTDATGVGGGISDTLVESFGDDMIEDICFSGKRKHIMGMNLLNILEELSIEYPSDENRLTEEFEKEFGALEKKWEKGGRLNYKHPEKGGFHDDYVDSLALALLFTQIDTGGEWDQLF